MKVGNCMTKDVEIASPQQTLRDAAEMMGRLDAGAMPVGENDRLVGMITIATSQSAASPKARHLTPRYGK